MVAATRTPPRTYPARRPSLCTLWTADERITGRYLGYHLENGVAYVVILECIYCEPRLIAWRDVVAAVKHRWKGKRHLGPEV